MGGKFLPDCCCLFKGNYTRTNPWPKRSNMKLDLGSGEGGKLVAWHMANVPSTAATSWSRPNASPTPQGSILKTQVSRWTSAAMSVSMSGLRQARPMSGRSANAPGPAIHAYLGGRLSHRHRKPCRRETQHAQPAGSLL